MIENYIRCKDVMFKYAVGKSVAQGTEIHPYHEMLLFVGKTAVFVADNIQMKIKPNTIIVIPKGHYHRFNIENQDSYERYVLNFFDNTENKNLIDSVLSDIYMIENPPIQITSLLYRLRENYNTSLSDAEHEIMLKSMLSLILLELKLLDSDKLLAFPHKQRTLISKAIEYIGTNYTKQIKIDDIAAELGVSTTKLASDFKSEMGISIHRYIVEKRLVYAYDRIANGENPTDVCYMCGYTDYSAFYRAYKKMFRKAPSDI